jgi:hypothetical protein
MPIHIRAIQQLDSQVAKIIVDGESVSSSKQIPVSQLLDYYDKLKCQEKTD